MAHRRGAEAACFSSSHQAGQRARRHQAGPASTSTRADARLGWRACLHRPVRRRPAPRRAPAAPPPLLPASGRAAAGGSPPPGHSSRPGARTRRRAGRSCGGSSRAGGDVGWVLEGAGGARASTQRPCARRPKGRQLPLRHLPAQHTLLPAHGAGRLAQTGLAQNRPPAAAAAPATARACWRPPGPSAGAPGGAPAWLGPPAWLRLRGGKARGGRHQVGGSSALL